MIKPLLIALSLRKSQMQRLMQNLDYQMKKMHMKTVKIIRNWIIDGQQVLSYSLDRNQIYKPEPGMFLGCYFIPLLLSLNPLLFDVCFACVAASQESTFTRISTNEFLHRSRKSQTIDEVQNYASTSLQHIIMIFLCLLAVYYLFF